MNSTPASQSATTLFTGSIALEEESKVLEDYLVGQRLGEGAYGSVYVVKYIPSGENFALKIVQKDGLFQCVHGYVEGAPLSVEPLPRPLGIGTGSGSSGVAGPGDGLGAASEWPNSRSSSPLCADPRQIHIAAIERQIVQEATVMQAMEHPHVVKLYKFLNSKSAYYFIMELAEGGELFDLVISKHYFSEDEARMYFQQLISAIDFCHRNGVAHKDLKAENLLLSGDGRLLVCDFGFSTKRQSLNLKEATDAMGAEDDEKGAFHDGNAAGALAFGTLHYMSPEAVLASTQQVFPMESATGTRSGDTTVMSVPSFLERAFPGGVMVSDSGPGLDSSSSRLDTGPLHEETFRRSMNVSGSPNGSRHSAVASLDTPALASIKDGVYCVPPLHPQHVRSLSRGACDVSSRSGLQKTTVLRTSASTGSLDVLFRGKTDNDIYHQTSSRSGATPNSFGCSTAKRNKPTAFTKVSSNINAFMKSLMGGGRTSSAHPSFHRVHPSSAHTKDVAGVGGGLHAGGNGVQPMANHRDGPPKLSRHQRDVAGSSSSTDLPNAASIMARSQPFCNLGLCSPVVVDAFQQDLWSAGVVLFFMLTGRLPFDGRDDEETLFLIQRNTFYFTEEETMRLSWEVRALLRRMLLPEPMERPTLEEIIDDGWFTKHLNPRAVFPHRPDLPEWPKATCSGDEIEGAFLDFSTQHVVTASEEAVLQTAFRKIDADGYGCITRDQIRDMLTTLHGDVVGSADVSELMALFTDDPESTVITFQQFREAWVSRDLAHTPFTHSTEFQLANIVGTQMDEIERQLVRQLRAAFDSVDEGHTGVIGLNQLRRVFDRCHIAVLGDELLSLIAFFHERGRAAPPSSSAAASAVSPTCADPGGISFDDFAMGIVQREILLRHPLGRKLAAATNLVALFQSRNVTECVHHGFLVSGLQNVVIDKLMSVRTRLRLLCADEVVSSTQNIYSFRYLGSAALESGATLETVSPLLMSVSLTSASNTGSCELLEASTQLGGVLTRGPMAWGPAGQPGSSSGITSQAQTASIVSTISERMPSQLDAVRGACGPPVAVQGRTSLSRAPASAISSAKSATATSLTSNTAERKINMEQVTPAGSAPSASPRHLRPYSTTPSRLTTSASAHTPSHTSSRSARRAVKESVSHRRPGLPSRCSSDMLAAESSVTPPALVPGNGSKKSKCPSPTSSRPTTPTVDSKHVDRAHGVGAKMVSGAVVASSGPLSRSSTRDDNKREGRHDKVAGGPHSPSLEHTGRKAKGGGGGCRPTITTDEVGQGNLSNCSSPSQEQADASVEGRGGGVSHAPDTKSTPTGSAIPRIGRVSMKTKGNSHSRHLRRVSPTSASNAAECTVHISVPATSLCRGSPPSTSAPTPRGLTPSTVDTRSHGHSAGPSHGADARVRKVGSSQGDKDCTLSSSGCSRSDYRPVSGHADRCKVSHSVSPPMAHQHHHVRRSECQRMAKQSAQGSPSILQSVPSAAMSTAGGVSFGHRTAAYGGSGAIAEVHGVCDVDVILAPACLGYTMVQFRRIHGKTQIFHEAVAFISDLLEVERQQAMEDTLPRGQSELM